MNKVKVSIHDLAPSIKETVDNHQTFELKVKGSSMFPTLKNNQTVVGLKKYDGTLQKNTIYFFKYKDKYILHRYIKRINHLIYFRGDNRKVFETLQSDDFIIAYVAYIKHKDKALNPYSWIRTLWYKIYAVLRKIR